MLLFIGLPAVVVALDAVSFFRSNRSNGFLMSSGREREYLLHVPASYDRSKPTPLIVSLHGAGGWPAQQMALTGWNRLADEGGFLVVYPSARIGPGPRVWEMDPARLALEVRFIADLIDTLRVAYNIDSTRVYADGLSNGGGMAFALSCTLSSRIAAVGMVAAAHLLSWRWCTDRTPVPMIAFHGTADPMIPFQGGRTWIASETFPSIPNWTAHWAQRNQCGATPRDSVVARDVTRIEYPGCAEDAAVVLYRIHGAGHSWPGGKPLPEWLVGTTSTQVDATREIWAFFQKHPLRRPLPGRP